MNGTARPVGAWESDHFKEEMLEQHSLIATLDSRERPGEQVR